MPSSGKKADCKTKQTNKQRCSIIGIFSESSYSASAETRIVGVTDTMSLWKISGSCDNAEDVRVSPDGGQQLLCCVVVFNKSGKKNRKQRSRWSHLPPTLPDFVWPQCQTPLRWAAATDGLVPAASVGKHQRSSAHFMGNCIKTQMKLRHY